jgi:CheY-like chemotaxis protein
MCVEDSPMMSGGAGTPRVLVAEDDAEMRAMLTASLRAQGLEVAVACDGFELRERLVSLDDVPDLIVSDVQMPGWTGLAALRWLSMNRPEVPVVLITAFGGPKIRARARQLGAVAVFDKPVDLGELLDAVLCLALFPEPAGSRCGVAPRP